MRVLFLLLALAGPVAAQNYVAPTDPKTPADELASFKLPPGFAAQLVAAEPDIGKPIQIAFDAKGRLWATTSRHYPIPAPDGQKPSDKLYVLSDIGPDGKAGKVTVFADDLNIPIGILPLPDCKSCLVSHAGSILKLTDTDGDGKADQRETILTGFGTKDTHGMMNSFTLLPDGWVYACHGYLNDSTVTAKDGSSVKMNSGNTFRFRPDGSRVEIWTRGQVNPFGMTADPWLNLYTADCHSMPITQLIRGATYQSFAKPDDGLGFAPHVTRHDHGSTALCGLAWYEADHFPKEWSGCMFLGNVVTNRVNADRIEWKGSTPVAKELPDFLTSSDPWFRPTDIKLGPDGALYVADFYNRIIGHYEVDLKHPGRDKDRGRLWRVVWQGADGKAKPPTMPDVTKLKGRELADALADGNLPVRLSATQERIHRGRPKEKVESPGVARMIKDLPKLARGTAYAAWIARAEGTATNERLERSISGLTLLPTLLGSQWDGLARSHLIRVAATMGDWTDDLRETILDALSEPSFTARAAVEALIAHPNPDNIAPLVKLIRECPPEDTHLRYAARVALRNAIRDANGWDAATKAAATPADLAVVADVALGVPTAAAATFLLGRLETGFDPKFCEHVGRYGDDPQAAVVTVLTAKRTDTPAAVKGLQALLRGVGARGSKLPAGAEVEAVCGAGLASADGETQQAAAELAGTLKLKSQFGRLVELAARSGPALAALVAIDPAKAVAPVAAVLADPATPAGVREKAAQALGAANRPDARAALTATLPTAPGKLAGVIAATLAGSPDGAAALLDAVKLGKASALLLQEKAVATKLDAIDGGKLKPRVAELTKGLPSPDAKLAGLLKQRAVGFAKAKPNAETGKQAFAKNCAACHQIAGQGAKVGPNLDGIGNRGAERLLEDVLDPNRNVDAAFRAVVLDLADGRSVTGLLLREEGQVLVVADNAGKEVRVPAADVEKRTVGPLSPMPANFDAAIPEAEFYALVKYLLDQRAK